MAKPKISAKDAVADVRSGMDNRQLMEKYGVNESGLRSLLTKLVQAGLLDQAELDSRLPGPSPTPAADAWKCPACGALQAERPYVCPQCGVIVAKYEKKAAGLKGAEPEPPEEQRRPEPQRETHGKGISAGMKRCPHCFQEIHADAAKCRHCGRWIEPPAAGEEPEGLYDKYCPWEDVDNLEGFEAFKQTVIGALFSPKDFFAKVPPTGGYAKPFVFGLIASTLGIVVAQLWNLLYQSSHGAGGFTMFLFVLFSPVIAAIGLGIGSAVTHLCLAVVGGANEEFEATFRVQCYAASAQLWNVVPFLGGFISAFWSIFAVVVGLREVHGTSTGTALLAVFLPLLVCCGLGIVALWFVGLAALMPR